MISRLNSTRNEVERQMFAFRVESDAIGHKSFASTHFTLLEMYVGRRGSRQTGVRGQRTNGMQVFAGDSFRAG